MASGEDLIVVQTLDRVETGQEYARIVPHSTVLSWFVLNSTYIRDVAETMDELMAEHGSRAAVGVGHERVLYGVDENIPACTVEVPNDPIHAGLMNRVDALGGEYKYERFARTLSSHITDEEGVSVQPGDVIHFGSLALISRRDDERGKRKVVEHSVHFESTHEATA